MTDTKLSNTYPPTPPLRGTVTRINGYRSRIPVLESYYPCEHKIHIPNFCMLYWLSIIVSNAKAIIIGVCDGSFRTYLQYCLEECRFLFSNHSFGMVLLKRLALAISNSALAYSKGQPHLIYIISLIGLVVKRNIFSLL